jgi:hypothetical protein
LNFKFYLLSNSSARIEEDTKCNNSHEILGFPQKISLLERFSSRTYLLCVGMKGKKNVGKKGDS